MYFLEDIQELVNYKFLFGLYNNLAFMIKPEKFEMFPEKFLYNVIFKHEFFEEQNLFG